MSSRTLTNRLQSGPCTVPQGIKLVSAGSLGMHNEMTQAQGRRVCIQLEPCMGKCVRKGLTIRWTRFGTCQSQSVNLWQGSARCMPGRHYQALPCPAINGHIFYRCASGRFKTLEVAIPDPGEFLLLDFAKFDRPPLIHVGMLALNAFEVRLFGLRRCAR